MLLDKGWSKMISSSNSDLLGIGLDAADVQNLSPNKAADILVPKAITS